MSTVYFASARTLRWNYENSVPGKLETLLEKLSLADRFVEDDWVAVTTRWESPGAFRIISTVMLRKVREAVQANNACDKFGKPLLAKIKGSQ